MTDDTKPVFAASKMKSALIAAVIFSMAMVGLWFVVLGKGERIASILGALYAFLCFAFLIFQAVAFIWAHTAYDQSVEATKLDPILLEDV